MKIKLLITTLFLFLTYLVSITDATAVDKVRAKAILIKTNNAIGITHMTVKRTRKFSGKLGLAVKHERFAKKLYEAGNFDKAVQHSLFARKCATEAMQENSAKTNTLFILSTEEKTILAGSASDDDLKKEANADNSTDIKDEELMNGNLNLEIL